MFGNTGFIHKPVKKTRKELRAMLLLEARSHASTCDELATAEFLIHPHSPTSAALSKAAKFIRRLAGEGD